MLDNMSRTTQARIIIILAGVLYGTWHHWGHIPPGFNEAFTITLLLLLAEQFVEISHRLKHVGSEGIYVVELDSVHDYYVYLSKKTRTCRKSWKDMGGIDVNLKGMPETNERRVYYEARSKLAASSQIQTFQYIGVFQDVEHFDRITALMRDSAASASCVRYYATGDHRVPQIEVTIVDGNEIIMGYYQPEEPLGGQKYIATNNGALVNLFLEYYKDLWHGGTMLKEGTRINEQALKQLHSAFHPGEGGRHRNRADR